MSAEWTDLPLATQAGEGRSAFISDAELVNLMLVPSPPGSPRPFAIMNTPGLSDPTGAPGVGAGLIRGMISHGSYLWYVKGTTLYYYDGVVETSVGAIAGASRVRMVGVDTNAIVIVDGTNHYRAITSAITAIVPPAGTYADAAFLNGLTLYARSGTDELYASDRDDPTTIGALSFTTIDAIADTLVGCVVDHQEVVVFGKRHIEFWYDAGAADFPLARSSPGVAERGCASAHTIAKYDNAIFFLGDDGRVYRLEGYRPVPISTEWVERLIGTPSVTAQGGIYSLDGRHYYVICQGAGSVKAAYDLTTGLWHRRNHTALSSAQYVGIANGPHGSLSGNAYIAVNTGGTSGAIYSLSNTTYRDSGAGSTDTTRTLTHPAVDGDGNRMFEDAVKLVAEKVSATATLAFSDDGGSTYTNHSAISMNQDRVEWPRCGSFRRRIHRLSIEGNARIAIEAVRARLHRGAA